jgi:hypothetical protein
MPRVYKTWAGLSILSFFTRKREPGFGIACGLVKQSYAQQMPAILVAGFDQMFQLSRTIKNSINRKRSNHRFHVRSGGILPSEMKGDPLE